MAQFHKVEGQTELKCHADKFFNAWTQKTHLVPEMCPKKMSKVELNEGNCLHSLGAVSTWHYLINGESELLKVKVKSIDGENKSVEYNCIEGNILRYYYKSFSSKIQAIPKDGGCFVKWSFEYEKKTAQAPDADMYIDFLLGCAKDMDANLSCA